MNSIESLVTITEDELISFESRSEVLSVSQVDLQEVEFEMESTGEGQTWREVRRFTLTPDLNTLTDITRSTHYVLVRCEQVPLPFVDEAPSNPEFLAFRSQLLEATAERDSEFILSIVAENIRNSFGGEGGIDEFKRDWRFDSPDSPFWTEFENVLRLGGAFLDDGSFVAPYITAAWPDNVDGFEHFAVIGSNVNVRSGPSLSAPVVDRMSHQTVRWVRGGPSGEWLQVWLADGGTGYINSDFVRSPIDYRAHFVRTGDDWVMRLFIAGD